MEAGDSLTSIEKCFLKHIDYLGPLLNGGKCSATLTSMLVLSPGMSSKLDLEVTTYLVVCSN
jgi:hypothetical protein